jgi:RHS repeat-associated protein
MNFLRSIALWLLLSFAAISTFPAYGANSVPPDVGNYSYGFIRCDTWHDGYASRAEDEQTGANYYYNGAGCGAQVTNPGPWATPTSPQGGTCGGDNITPSYFLGVESYNKTNDGVTYKYGPSCAYSSYDGMTIRRIRAVSCPPGYTPNGQTNLCDPPPPSTPDPTKNNNACHAGCNGTDPINSATGAMVVNEPDFVDPDHGLDFERIYTSGSGLFDPTSLGSQWRDTFDRRISVITSGSVTVATSYRANGDRYHFVLTFGQWRSDSDVAIVLTSTSDGSGNITGWTLNDTDGTTELYDANGYLIKIIYRDQRTLTLAYGGSYGNYTYGTMLGTVTDERGRVLTFKYAPLQFGSLAPVFRLVEVDTPDSLSIKYGYDSSTGMLNSVSYVGTVNGQSVTQTRTYVYGENGAHNYAMTGLVDEAGQRYTSWSYDAQGRATLSVHGATTDYPGRTELTYNADGSTSIKNWIDGTASLSFTRLFAFNVVQGVANLASVSCGSCASAAIQLPGIPEQPSAVTYDASGYPTSSTDFNHVVTTTQYDDASGLLTQKVEASGAANQRTTNTTWNTTLRVPLTRTVLDANGNTVAKTAWTYNATGQPLAHCEIDPAVAAAASYTCANTGTVPAGVRRWTYTYCDAVDGTQCPLVGLLLSAIGPRTDLTQTTSYAYYLDDTSAHRHGDLKTVTDALGHVTTLASYDGAGRITRTIDPNSSVTDYTYTPRGWLASRTVRFNPDGSADTYNDATTKITYTAYGAVQTIRDADGVNITYGYDAAHRLTTITDALGNVIQYTLDASGNRTAEKTFATGSSTPSRTLTRTFNPLGQLTQVVDGLNHTVFDASASGSYDGNGNLLQSNDANGIVHQQSYDALNRLVQRIDNLNGADTATRNTTTIQRWDALDRLTQVIDPSNLTTTYGYDGLSNPISLSSPDSGISYASFDAAGNMLSRTDANGITVSHSYDALDRRLSDSYADSTLNASYHYDDPDSVVSCSSPGLPANPIGHLTRIVESTVTTTWCYDHNDHLAQQAQLTAGHTDLTRFYFSGAGRLGGRTAPDNIGTFYNYDRAGRVVNVVIPPVQPLPNGASPVQQITYLPFGPMTSYRLNNQIITRSYDANYALTDITSAALNLHFARDPLGNIIAEGNTAGASPAVESYSYDPLNQLKAITQGSTTVESYSYNPTGDRLSKTAAGLATGTYLYTNGTHQLASINGLPRANDANGNTTGSVVGGNTYGFGYNGRNRMTVVQANGATVGTYLYNALGQRIQKTTTAPTATTQRYFYDEQSHVIGEYTVGGSNRDTIWLGDMPVATVDTTGSTSVVNFVIGDGLGTPRVVIDGTGTAIWSWAYLGNPFGEQQPTSNGYVLNLRFPGQYYDAESGTNYNVNRNYESATGRYLQSDPMGLAGGISTYTYVGNSPLGYIDPLGLNVTMTCRPLSGVKKYLGWTSPKHCGDFVWHWATDPCTGKKYKVIDSQFSLAGFTTSPATNPNDPTYVDDRAAFYNPGGGNTNYNIPTPAGMTPAQFDQNVTSWGKQYSQGPYSLFPGPNSNTAAYDIIYGAGGTPPNVPDAPGNLYYVTPRFPPGYGQ